jgi:hypothetical protein
VQGYGTPVQAYGAPAVQGQVVQATIVSPAQATGAGER